jgi:hypothetical protein
MIAHPAFTSTRQNALPDQTLAYSRGGWLAGERVELNAMTSEQWVAFLEKRLVEVGVCKMVPGEDVLEIAFRRATEIELINRGIQRLSPRARNQAQKVTVPTSLASSVQRKLQENPALSWDMAVADVVGESLDERQK